MNFARESICGRALSLCARRLDPAVQPLHRLDRYGTNAVVRLLIDLEVTFDIGLDVDEALPHATVAELLRLVEQRAGAARPRPAQVCRLYDLATERARRARPVSADEVA